MALTVRIASDEKELAAIFKLRYRVYCQEWGFDKHLDHTDEMITDIFDDHAIHFVALDESRKVVGALMLILKSSEGYPLEKYCELDINKDELPAESLAEISRLVIHRDYRKRAEDKYIYGHDEERRSIGSFDFPQTYPGQGIYSRRADDKFGPRRNSRRNNESYTDKRRRHEVIISLYKAAYIESKRRNITHWYSIMTKGILNLLCRFGFEFQAIGDPVDYHGIRTPYMGDLEKIEQEMSVKVPELYNEFTSGL